MQERLSVIITAYDNFGVTVAHVREAMNALRMPDEIIIVNDAGDVKLRDMLLALPRKTKVIYARVNEDIAWNYTGARNLGFWLSTGDFISMEDNDNIPSPQAYHLALEHFKERPEIGRCIYGRRKKATSEEVINKPYREWRRKGLRATHQDTQMLRREVILKAKGCDERFAGQYAWACADWRRRLLRLGIISSSVNAGFVSVWDAETLRCHCENENPKDGFCQICGKVTYRKSYVNYKLARENISEEQYQSLSENERLNHKLSLYKEGKAKNYAKLQSPRGMLNFTYTWEILP